MDLFGTWNSKSFVLMTCMGKKTPVEKNIQEYVSFVYPFTARGDILKKLAVL